jgi:pimeloyl-ACP methyl ester carboxylesterase
MTPAARQIESLNGVELYFEVHGAGEPLLLLHGFSGCSQDWSMLVPQWADHFQLIVPDLRGHGRSSNPAAAFRFSDAAADIIALLDYLGVGAVKALGISGGGNVLLHLATRQPARVGAMVLVSATSYFPAQARAIMRQYPDKVTEADREVFRRRHPGGDPQIDALLANTRGFADSYDDMNFTPPLLSTITARTLIVGGDRDPLYPVEIPVEMARAIPRSSLWIVPNAGHGPVGGERWGEFVRTAFGFLRE